MLARLAWAYNPAGMDRHERLRRGEAPLLHQLYRMISLGEAGRSRPAADHTAQILRGGRRRAVACRYQCRLGLRGAAAPRRRQPSTGAGSAR